MGKREILIDARLTLEKRISAEIAGYDGHFSVYADDLKGNTLQIDSSKKFETASTIKTFILAYLFQEVEQGHKSLDDKVIYIAEHSVEGSGLLRSFEPGGEYRVKDVATLMIIVSDNVATNLMIAYLGLENINAYIQKEGWKDTVLHNPIHFEQYEKLGTTTPNDYADVFKRLVSGQLISPNADAQMIDILKKQHYNKMLTANFPTYFMDSEDLDTEELFSVASKSGSMDACRNDGGIVYTPYGPYVVVLMSSDFQDPLYYDGHPALQFGAKISRLLFDQFLALEGRFTL